LSRRFLMILHFIYKTYLVFALSLWNALWKFPWAKIWRWLKYVLPIFMNFIFMSLIDESDFIIKVYMQIAVLLIISLIGLRHLFIKTLLILLILIFLSPWILTRRWISGSRPIKPLDCILWLILIQAFVLRVFRYLMIFKSIICLQVRLVSLEIIFINDAQASKLTTILFLEYFGVFRYRFWETLTFLLWFFLASKVVKLALFLAPYGL